MVKSVNLVIIVGILRSGGDTIFAAALDGLAVWGLGVPLAILTGLVLKWDLPFVYAAILFEEMAKLGFGLKRMKSKRWMNNLVEHQES
jgi:Na+-driven multidrug efflux pump